MSAFKASYINELYKLSKKKKIIVAAILSLAVVVIGAVIVSVVNNFMGIKVTGSSEFSIFILSIMNYTLIPLFTLFITVDMFAGEMNDRSIKHVLTRPVSRFKIYTAKAAAVATFILADLLFVMLISQIAGLVIHASTLSFLKVFVAYLVSFFPLMAFAMFTVLVSNIMRGPTSSFLICVVCYLLLCGLSVVFSYYQSFFFVTAFNWHTLFLGSYLNWGKIFRMGMILLGCCTMFYAGGYYLFMQKDI